MKDKDWIYKQCNRMLLRDATLEEITAFLKKEGLSKVQSMVVLAEICDMPLQDAKDLVHNSRTWVEVKGRDEEFHQRIP